MALHYKNAIVGRFMPRTDIFNMDTARSITAPEARTCAAQVANGSAVCTPLGPLGNGTYRVRFLVDTVGGPQRVEALCILAEVP